MAEQINRVVIEYGGSEYEFDGDGQPNPDSVGSDEIKDGSIAKQDLSQEVLDMIGSGGQGFYGVPQFRVDTDTMELKATMYETDPTRFYLEDGVLKARTPLPVEEDSIGSEQIRDNSILMEDLNDSVKDKIQKTYVQDDETLHMDFDEKVEE